MNDMCNVCGGPDGEHFSTCSRWPEEAEGKKYDTGKPRPDLIPPHMESEVARVLAFGAEKYGPGNWRKLDNLKPRYTAAALRHINAMRRGEQLDPESGLQHAAHAVCCLMFLGEDELERCGDSSEEHF